MMKILFLHHHWSTVGKKSSNKLTGTQSFARWFPTSSSTNFAQTLPDTAANHFWLIVLIWWYWNEPEERSRTLRRIPGAPHRKGARPLGTKKGRWLIWEPRPYDFDERMAERALEGFPGDWGQDVSYAGGSPADSWRFLKSFLMFFHSVMQILFLRFALSRAIRSSRWTVWSSRPASSLVWASCSSQ